MTEALWVLLGILIGGLSVAAWVHWLIWRWYAKR